MSLIDKYVAEIGDRLPRQGRADIEAEIRSTLQDMLDDRSRQTGLPVDDALIKAVLKEYGSPAKVAATYKPAQYLIGPQLYPNFEMVLKIVLAVVVGVSLLQLGLIMTANASGPAFARALAQFGGQLIGMALTAFGNVTLIFAILDRVLSNKRFDKQAEPWDPNTLAERPDRDAVKRFDLIASIVFALIGLALLNLYADKIGLALVIGGKWVFIPVLTEAFYRYLPWINVLSVAKIGLELVLLRMNAWSLATRLFSLAERAAETILALAILTGPAIVGVSPAALAGTPLAESAGTIASGVSLSVSLGVSIALVVVVVVGLINIIKTVYRLATRGSARALPITK